jgi:hypothetical protein
MRTRRLLPLLAVTCIFLSTPRAAHPQAQPQAKPPQSIHWCGPVSKDDSTHAIAESCEAYSECLGAVGLFEAIDRPPFTGLSDSQIKWVKRCHQTLHDAASAHPRIDNSKETQAWLEHAVYPGTEAQPLTAPSPSSPPR